jgi:putative transposase
MSQRSGADNDRGSRYSSHDYQKTPHGHALQSSMSGKGNCHDNAAVGAFFKIIKAELVWRRMWQTCRQAKTTIFQYINGFHNPRRRHSALGGNSYLQSKARQANRTVERNNYANSPLGPASAARPSGEVRPL